MKIAGVQYTAGADWQANLRQLEELLDQVPFFAPDILVLPENVFCQGGDYRALAELHGQALLDWLSATAQRLGVWLVAGSVPLVTRPDGAPVPAPRVRAALLVISPQGQQVARYDKLHLFDVEVGDSHGRYQESDQFEPGDQVVLADLGGLKTGLMICYDLRFPLLAQRLRQRGAELLIYPSAFTEVTGRAHWELLLRARAVETGCYVLGVNQCGWHSPTRQSFGHSMLVDPWGQPIRTLQDAPGLLVAEINLDEMHDIRRRLPVHDHQRLAVSLPDGLRES
ncbi:MAG: carbon-nitrogen hydrolase family protein [Alcanivoracaceae bacterium]|nr:carbon-nitrogen hydrolase family protein [Alcanivoracaceae bacterium]